MTTPSKLKQLIGAGCFIALSGLLFNACGETDSGSKDGDKCESTELFAKVYGKEGCYTKCVNDKCAVGVCNKKNGICIGDAKPSNNKNNKNNTKNNKNNTKNNKNNNKSTNNKSTNNKSTNNKSTNNKTTNEKPLEKLCKDAFKKYFSDCVNEQCTVNVELQGTLDSIIARETTDTKLADCAANLAANADVKANFESILAGECSALKSTYCTNFGLVQQCSCMPSTKVGAVCTMSDECSGGDFQPGCITEARAAAFKGGYCTSGCVDPGETSQNGRFATGGMYAADDQCGAGNVCLITVDDKMTADKTDDERSTLCLDGCTQKSDCRSGYTCAVGSVGTTQGTMMTFTKTCLPLRACQSNMDCGGGTCTNNKCEKIGSYLCNDMAINANPGAETSKAACIRDGGECINDRCMYIP